MAYQSIPLDKPYYNVDSTSLTSNVSVVKNGYIDEMGAFHKRAGYRLFCDLGTLSEVAGVYWSENEECLIAVSNGRTFKINSPFGDKVDITGDIINPHVRVNFVEKKYGGANYLFMVANSSPVFTNFTDATQKLTPTSNPPLTGTGTPPTNCTHLIHFFSYLIGNNKGDMAWSFSYPGNPFQWDGADSYDITSQENVEGIYKGASNFMVCSKSTLDIWGNSRSYTDPFLSPVKAQYSQIGLASPHACVVIDGDKMIFLDKTRRLVVIQGTSYINLGLPINREIQNLSTVNDAVAFNIAIDGKQFLLLNFPQEKKTFVYDYISKSFYKWSSYDESISQESLFRANCYAYCSAWNKHIIGDIDNGKLYSLDNDHYSDDSNTINAEIITGHINYGSDAVLKKPRSVCARIKRGVGKETDVYDSPRILVRHRDNGGTWSNFKEVDLGKVGDTEFKVNLYTQASSYYTRQYHIKMPDPAPFVLSGMWEEF